MLIVISIALDYAMRPTLRQLEYLIAVADTGRIGMAAAQLNVSQPSLSAQIAEVETTLGATLFLRGRTGATLTATGEEVVRRARLILQEHQDLCAVAKGAGIFGGRLRLGVLPSIGPYLLPGVVRRLHAEHPSLRLLVREESTRDLDQGLRAGRFDMIISTPEDHPGTRITTLFTEQLWLATPLDHRLADQGAPVPLDQLRGETLLTIGAGHRLSHVVAGLAAQSGAQVSQEYEGTSLDAVRLMAASGTGLAILPEVYALSEAKRGTDLCLRPLAGAGTSRTLSLIQPALPDPRTGSDILINVLRAEAARILRP